MRQTQHTRQQHILVGKDRNLTEVPIMSNNHERLLEATEHSAEAPNMADDRQHLLEAL